MDIQRSLQHNRNVEQRQRKNREQTHRVNRITPTISNFDRNGQPEQTDQSRDQHHRHHQTIRRLIIPKSGARVFPVKPIFFDFAVSVILVFEMKAVQEREDVEILLSLEDELAQGRAVFVGAEVERVSEVDVVPVELDAGVDPPAGGRLSAVLVEVGGDSYDLAEEVPRLFGGYDLD